MPIFSSRKFSFIICLIVSLIVMFVFVFSYNSSFWGTSFIGVLYLTLFIYIFNLFLFPAAAAAKSLQSCPTMCDPIDGSPPGFPIPGILQPRTLEWVAISFSSAWKWKWKWSHVQLLATPWTAAHQAAPSIGFSRQEYWGGLPFPSPGDLPDPEIKPGSPELQADALPSEPPEKPWQLG